MPVTVIVGGQFGSEGKGKVAHHFARERRAAIVVRVGGTNSGHTVIDNAGVPRVFRTLPTAALLDSTVCVLGAGSYIDTDILHAEMKVARLTSERLVIDPNAYVVSGDHKRIENRWKLRERIGSTGSGTGGAVADRITRQSAVHLAQNDPRLVPYTQRSVRSFLRSALDRDERVIIEGTQGFGLSILHSPYYPKVTSRDTTAAAFVSEAGLSPLDVDKVVLVIRAFPIRVPGDSGYLPKEIDWDILRAESGWPFPLVEHTSVTDQVRRVGRFDPSIVRDAIEINNPTDIVMNHADYFDHNCHRYRELTAKVELEVSGIEAQIDHKLAFVGIGPDLLISRKR